LESLILGTTNKIDPLRGAKQQKADKGNSVTAWQAFVPSYGKIFAPKLLCIQFSSAAALECVDQPQICMAHSRFSV